jgi:hypothetical protein
MRSALFVRCVNISPLDRLLGALTVDYIPSLKYLPKFLQPWKKTATSVMIMEFKIHKAFLQVLKEQLDDGLPAECFGTNILRV